MSELCIIQHDIVTPIWLSQQLLISDLTDVCCVLKTAHKPRAVGFSVHHPNGCNWNAYSSVVLISPKNRIKNKVAISILYIIVHKSMQILYTIIGIILLHSASRNCCCSENEQGMFDL